MSVFDLVRTLIINLGLNGPKKSDLPLTCKQSPEVPPQDVFRFRALAPDNHKGKKPKFSFHSKF